MLKYAKVINEETKQCVVGFEDPDKVFEEKTIPAITHTETIPAEYDEEGNLVKEEEVITVVDEEEKVIVITYGDYYKSCGMEEMDIEQAWDGRWFVEGYAPEQPAPTKDEIRQLRQYRYEAEADPIRYDYDEALARGEESAEQLKQEWLASKDKIREELPYIVGEEDETSN